MSISSATAIPPTYSAALAQPVVHGFPPAGTRWAALEDELLSLKSQDFDWRGGRLPAMVYYYDEQLSRVQMDAYRLYSVENALGEGLAYKSLTRMMADIRAMIFDLLHVPAEGAFTFTSGGTESIFEAVRTARNHFRSRHPHKAGERLNVVAPYSAHASLSKAGAFLDIDIVRVPLDAERRGDVQRMAEAVNGNTIMLFASAPCYPYGLFDPIAALGQVALQRRLWLHVDACFGGFLSPFAQALGYRIPEWDLRVPGVTSLSADMHKYGYSAKGASALIFRDAQMQQFERFEFSDWPRGTYVSKSFCGSAAAGAVASVWAVMRFLGFEGYLQVSKATMDATRLLVDGVNGIPGLQCLSPNMESALYAYESVDDGLDIMAVADQLQAQGWLPGRLREPLAIQQGVSPVHLAAAPGYLSDLRQAVDTVRRAGLKGTFNARTY